MELVPYQSKVESLTEKYWFHDEAERNAATNLLEHAFEKGRVLDEINKEVPSFRAWIREQGLNRATVYRYITLHQNKNRLVSHGRPPFQSIRQALEHLATIQKVEQEANDLQDNIIKAAKRFMETLVTMREFLEENEDTEFDIKTEFVFSIDEAKIALDKLNERVRYERSTG